MLISHIMSWARAAKLHACSFRWNLTKCSQGWPPFWKPYVQVPCIKFQYFTCHETPIFPSLTNRNLTGEYTCQGVPSRGEGRRCSTVEFCWMVAQLDGPDLRCSVIMNDNGVFGGICVVVFFLSKLCWDTSHLLVSWLVHVVIRNLLPTDHVFCSKCSLKLWIRAPCILQGSWVVKTLSLLFCTGKQTNSP